MYNTMTSGSSARASAAEPGTAPAPLAVAPALPAHEPAGEGDEFLAGADDTPFVEIGGPRGPIFSAPKLAEEAGAAEQVATSTAAAEPARTDARTYPRLAGPAYLSIRFHDLTGRRRDGAELEGPDPGLVALHLPDHPISGEYRTLRDEVRAQLPDPTPRVLFFTAAAGEAGTTTVLLNLAVTIAREAEPRVLVIDANLDHPAVADRLALKKPAPGLAEVLAQQVPLVWAAQASAVPNLQVLTAGTASPESPAVLGQDLPKLIDQLRQWYDWVLIDAGVWGAMPERDAVCPSADAVYLVTRAADVDRSEFAGLRGWVRELGGLLRGYIATRT